MSAPTARGLRACAFAVALAVFSLAVPAKAAAKRSLYVVGNGADTVAGFDIGADGGLVPFGAPVASGGTDPVEVAITPDGRHLYVVNIGSDTVTGFAIAADGALTPVGSPAATGDAPRGIAISPDGTRLHVSNANAMSISTFAIGADGALSAVGAPVPSGDTNTSGLALSPDGAQLFALHGGNDSTVAAFTIGAGGTPSANGAPVSTGGNDGRGIAIRPNGRTLYAASADGGIVTSFNINASGQVNTIGLPHSTGGSDPVEVAVSPLSDRVFVTNANSSNLTNFAIGPGGGLTEPGTLTMTGGALPNGVAVDPGGGHLYAVNGGPDTLAAFTIAAGGSLSPISGSPFASPASNPGAIAVTPDQPPAATVTLARGDAPFQVSFDGTGSTDGDGQIAGFAWDFGDGQTQDGGATATHTYPGERVYTARLTLTDNEGCSTAQVFTGQTMSCNGGPSARAEVSVDLDPPGLTISGKKAHRVGRTVKSKALCDEPCEVAGEGRLVVRPKNSGRATRKVRRFKLKPATKALEANRRRAVKLKLGKRPRKVAERTLGDNGKAKAKLRFTASDQLTTSTTKKRTVKLRDRPRGG